MNEYVVLLSVPGLRSKDVDAMPRLKQLVAGGDSTELVSGFPAVTCSVQSSMTTGVTPDEHGVVGNGFFWREQGEVEMWTAPNDCILRPQLWDIMHEHDAELTAAVWFPLHSKFCGADYVCTPAPIHNPDGSESLWCYTKPESFYGEIVEQLGHFPLQHFWGPMANIKGTAWIVASAVEAARRYRPNLFYIYLPHLDYAAQKIGPDSPEALQALVELDEEIGRLIDGFEEAYQEKSPLWVVASEYVITPVDHVTYPNRVLREAGLLTIDERDGREYLNPAESKAWAMADHQFSHVFVREADPAVVNEVCNLFANVEGIAEVLTRDQLDKYYLVHERTGDLVLVSTNNSWQAYYWWLDDARAPEFARTVDIHRKPGYDPVEMFWDPVSKGIPLDPSLVKGSHGAPPVDPSQRGVLLASSKGVFVEQPLAETDVADIVLRQFGI